MSPTNFIPGLSAVKSRPTKSGAGLAAGFALVRLRRRRLRAANPASRISRSTRLRDTRMPCTSRNSAWTRGEPYRRLDWVKMWRISEVNAPSVTSWSDGDRDSQS